MDRSPREHAVELALPPERALAALEKTADGWGAELVREGEGGRLALPVVAGLRRGWVRGRVTVERAGGGARLAFAVEESDYHLQGAAVVVLLLALAGGVVAVLWPFYPRLLAVAPLGVAVALGAWLLVLSKLANSGPEEFMAQVAAESAVAGRARADADS